VLRRPGLGAARATGAGLDFGVTPDQDAKILRIRVGWSLFNLNTPSRSAGDRRGQSPVQSINQAVWPSNSPVLGIFFACCGVIFAVS
jgi:hypothetical protein